MHGVARGLIKNNYRLWYEVLPPIRSGHASSRLAGVFAVMIGNAEHIGQPGADDIRTELARITGGVPFAHSPQLASFLRFVVEVALDGRGDRLKGYTIGVEALGRSADFDPQLDPIVRVEACRLRRALAHYYGAEGARDLVVIDLPLGRYVPKFRWSTPPPGWLRALRAVQRVLRARISLQMPVERR